MRHLLLTSLLAMTCLSSIVGCKNKPEVKDDPLITDEVVEEVQVDEEAALAHVSTANEHIRTRDWRAAASSYKRAVEANPKDWRLHMERAIFQSKSNNFLGAIESMSSAMELGGEREWIAWFNLGNIYQNRGMYHESLESYRVAVGLTGEPNVDVLLNISSSYLFLGRYDEATETISYILTIEPDDVRALHNNAMIPHMQFKHDEALIAYDAVLAVAPDYPQTIFNRAHVLSQLGRFREAAAAYERYIQVDPDGAYVKRARARVDEYRKK